MDKTNVYEVDVAEKTFNDITSYNFYITDNKEIKKGDYILFRVVVKDEKGETSYTGTNAMLIVNNVNDTFAGLAENHSVVFLNKNLKKVRKMNNMEKVFNTAVAILATFFTYLFGGWDLALKILITFMVLDYVTGVIYAYVIKTLNSEVGFRGLIKKCMILAVLIVGVELDRMLGNGGTWVFRTLVAYFYIANEGISLLENISNLGVPIPNKIKTALEQLNNDEDQENE